MRPTILDPLFQTISGLQGIGPKLTTAFEKLCGTRMVDIVTHIPREALVRHRVDTLDAVTEGQNIITAVEIVSHAMPARRGQPFRVTCENNGTSLTLVFFNGSAKYWAEQLPKGTTRVITGRVEIFNDALQIVHPDTVIAVPDDGTEPLTHAGDILDVEPLYPLSAGITHKTVHRAVEQALDKIPELPEWIDDALLKREKWLGWYDTLHRIHNPHEPLDFNMQSPYRRRLAYDEFLANQLALQIIRHKRTKLRGQSIKGDFRLRDAVLNHIPFDLTNSQKTALDEIYDDMGKEHRMLRLLQGDVGSGKTVVALLAMLNAIEAGGQACLMAPTEILARQHGDSLVDLCEKIGVRMVVLTARDKGKKRSQLLEEIAIGDIDIIVGTHALFQDDVIYKDLKLAIIDEQHRFGVEQRLQLSRKGTALDMVVMTATPIPRSLMLSAYGDMDYSQLRDKPAGREPIDTRLINNNRIPELIDSLERAVDAGAQIYWVCPLVEESQKIDLAAAEDRYNILRQHFGDEIVSLVHGRMKGTEKDEVMARFASGKSKILVATTVIEVGVNVVDATVMVIEQAERFGLAQLHQLRGRVGRGSKKGTCLLVFGDSLSKTAEERITVMRDTEDGFIIAEKDLELRGYGEILGTKQSGLSRFSLADMAEHADLLAIASDQAKLILQKNPDLQGEDGEKLRNLLYLFERDIAFHTMHSG